MLLIYSLGVRFYYALIYLAYFFNKKAALWIKGRRDQVIKPQKKSLWFHFASLGEFEQGRPVLEELKKTYPSHPVVVTFFSPSGYEVRKNTPLADAVYYLPLDTPANAQYFIEQINPVVAVFTKYEYWYYFFNQLKKREVPLYIISGIFRPDQVFFKWYGGIHRKILSFVSYFFVQDARSVQLLSGINLNNVTISGDTRFDRVWTNVQQPKVIQYINEFKNSHQLFIGGSTWPADEALLAVLVKQYPDWKFIFAPHEISEDKINALIKLFTSSTAVRYSELSSAQYAQPEAYQVLIIDNIGMLSALYQYADIAYIGGGFGVGIHNTIEAAAFGLPVIFGPEYKRFKEARDLITEGAGFSITDEVGLTSVAGRLMNDPEALRVAAQRSQRYVQQNVGATSKIVSHIRQYLSV